MREQVQALEALGPFPSDQLAAQAEVARYEQLLMSIEEPVTDEEARVLCRLFGPDDLFGLSWQLVHLVESAPGWPLDECLKGDAEWQSLLRTRLGNARPQD